MLFILWGDLVCLETTEICILKLVTNETVPEDANLTIANINSGLHHLCVVKKDALKFSAVQKITAT